MSAPVECIGFGGGVQTGAMLVLAARGALRFRLAVFANVGEDSEDAGTLAYVRHIWRPYAQHHGIEFAEVQATIGGEPDTILQKKAGAPRYLTRYGVPLIEAIDPGAVHLDFTVLDAADDDSCTTGGMCGT